MKKEEVLRKAKKRFTDNLEWTRECRKEFGRNADFSLWNSQWEPKIASARLAKGRPALSANSTLPLLNHMVNTNLTNRPGINITPADEYGDEKLAQMLLAIFRGIERNSNAGEECYRTACINLMVGGYCFILIDIKYKSEQSFEKEIIFKEVLDPRTIVWDVNSFWSGEELEFAFKVHYFTKEGFEKKYPKAKKTSFSTPPDEVGSPPFGDDAINVVEYWERKKTKDILRSFIVKNPISLETEEININEEKLLAESRVFLKATNSLPDDESKNEIIAQYINMIGAIEVKRREIDKYEITHRFLSGEEILKEDIFPGEKIPVIIGHTHQGVNEQNLRFQNLISPLMDSQRLKNYSMSNTAEQVGKGINPLFLGPRGMIPTDRRPNWSYNNIKDAIFLEYNPDSGPPPQYIPPSQPAHDPTAESAWRDMQILAGTFEPQLGSPSNEISGVAISKREQQGLQTNNHFRVALGNLFINLTKCAVGLILSVYKDNKHVDAVSESENVELMKSPFSEVSDEAMSATWRTSVISGPPYATQKEEALDKLMEIAKSYPDAMPLVGDLLISNMNFEGMDTLKNRLRTLLPEAIREAESVQEEEPDPAVLKMELASLKEENEKQKELLEMGQAKLQELEQATALVQQRDQQQFLIKQRELELKEAEIQAKLTVDESIRDEELNFNVKKLEIELGFKAEQSELDRKHELEKIILENQVENGAAPSQVEVQETIVEIPSLDFDVNEEQL